MSKKKITFALVALLAALCFAAHFFAPDLFDDVMHSPRDAYTILTGSAPEPQKAEPQQITEYRLLPPVPVSQYSRHYIPNRSGLRKHAMYVNFLRRSYYVYTPRPVQDRGNAAAVILLHESRRDGVSMGDMWRQAADRHHLKLVAPDGRFGGWVYKDNRRFIRRLIKKLRNDPHVDPDRIYIVGHAHGGALAITMGAEFSDDIAAVGTHAGMVDDQRHLPIIAAAPRKIPYCLLTGTENARFPLAQVRWTAETLAHHGHPTVMIEIYGHNEWYYTLADWFNETLLQCMMYATRPTGGDGNRQ
ncbi:MAG: hypothetical protein EA357_10960 [Micavibrio sp.]|nr:MAG: hypothetical protein EA357_10960 [Micavibrio sp.]